MIYETDMREFSGIRCVIQARQCLDGSIQQRHIYYQTQVGEHDPPWVQNWIPAATRKLEVATRNMRPAPHVLDEQGELIAALRDIANGHNDARGRAFEALDLIKGFRS